MSVMWPFDQYHPPFHCKKCGRLLRYSAIQRHTFIVSEIDPTHTEILSKNHECRKDKSKGGAKKCG